MKCLKQQRSECVMELSSDRCEWLCRQGAVPAEEAVRTKPPSAAVFHGTGDPFHTNFALPFPLVFFILGFRLGDTEAPSEMVAGPSVKQTPQKVMFCTPTMLHNFL